MSSNSYQPTGRGGLSTPPSKKESPFLADKWDGLNHSPSLDSAPNTSILDAIMVPERARPGEGKKD
jgi:hypothetical protein